MAMGRLLRGMLPAAVAVGMVAAVCPHAGALTVDAAVTPAHMLYQEADTAPCRITVTREYSSWRWGNPGIIESTVQAGYSDQEAREYARRAARRTHECHLLDPVADGISTALGFGPTGLARQMISQQAGDRLRDLRLIAGGSSASS